MIVPDYQLSLAIGKEGQNARLAARLTGWRIDIKTETQFADEQRGGPGAGRLAAGPRPRRRPPAGAGRRAAEPAERRARRKRAERRSAAPDGAGSAPSAAAEDDGRDVPTARRATVAVDRRAGGGDGGGVEPWPGARPGADVRRVPGTGRRSATCSGCVVAGRRGRSGRTRGSAPGRGAYVHRDEACVEAALSHGALARALRAGLATRRSR